MFGRLLKIWLILLPTATVLAAITQWWTGDTESAFTTAAYFLVGAAWGIMLERKVQHS